MEYVPKRTLEKKKRHAMYLEIYKGVKKGINWGLLAKMYHYKNDRSMRATYYLYIVPFLKTLEGNKKSV